MLNIRKTLCVALFMTISFYTHAVAGTRSLKDLVPLPFDLAFNQIKFSIMDRLAVSTNNNIVAYVINQPNKNIVRQSGLIMPNGTPYYADGSKISLTNLDNKGTKFICAKEGNQWFPVWSPDGRQLAFYSDIDGQPQLWIYTVATNQCHKPSSALIKTSVFLNGEPQWGPDSQTVFVTLEPNQVYRSITQETISTKKNGVSVTVHRSGDEMSKEQTKSQVTDGMFNDDVIKFASASFAKININNGSIQIVLSAEAKPRPMYQKVSPSGRWISYLSVFKRSKDIANSGMTLDIAIAPTTSGVPQVLATDQAMSTNFEYVHHAWHPKEDLLIYLKDDQLWIMRFERNKPQKATHLGVGLGKLAKTLLSFTKDGQSVIVGVEPEEEITFSSPHPLSLAIVPLNGGKPIRVKFDHKNWSFEGVLKADTKTLWQPKDRTITLHLQEKKSGEFAIVRINLDSKKQTILWQGYGKHKFLTSGRSQKYITGIFENYKTPPNVFQYDTEFSNHKRLTTIEPRLDNIKVGQFKVFTTRVPLYDGTMENLRTSVLLPTRIKGDIPPPAIVMFYPESD